MTGPDNQRFENLLRRELKADASSARADCPGPEQLAALWERSLSRAERALVESHVAGCARCQSAMAAMARAESGAEAPAVAHAPGLWWRLAAPAAVLTVVVIMIATRMLGTGTPNRREQIAMAIRHRLHRHHLNSAAVLTPAPPPSAKTADMLARAKAPPSKPEAVARADKPSKENPIAPPPRELAMSERKAAEPAAEQPRAQVPRQAASAPPPLTREAETAATGAAAPAAQAIAPQQVPSAPVQGSMAGPITGAAIPGAAPGAPPAAQVSSGQTNQGGVPAAEEHHMQTAAREGNGSNLVQPQFAQAPAGQAMPAPGPAVSTNVLPGRATFVPQGLRPGFASFQSPPPVIAWNIGADGLIQRLRQNGWETLHSGTSVDLLSGAAPSTQVCWVVGKDGTVLRTIDGGDHWAPIAPPAPVELVKIEASGADSATVTTADGRRFSTTDGGQDWIEEQ